MGRALGSNALAAGAFETTPGTTPGAGAWFKIPFVSHTLGEERPLIPSDLLGQGREMQDPVPDVATNTGDIVVPVDVRNFGHWLRLAFGAPVTTGAPVKASGVLTLSANVASGDTVTIDAKVYTFQSALTEIDGHVLVGADAAASIANLYHAINASGGTAGTDYALATTAHRTVSATAMTSGTLTVSARVFGPSADAIATTAASADASWADTTLSGGALASHVFTSGAQSLDSMSIEIGAPEVPAFGTSYGSRLNSLKISMARSGLLNATCSLICIGESTPVDATVAGSPAELAITRFAQATGSVKKDGAQLGGVVSADFTFSNTLDPVETIKADGRIEDSDPGQVMMSGTVTVKFANRVLLDAATASPPQPMELDFGWTSGDMSLVFSVGRVFMPLAKRPISGPKGIQSDFNWQSSGAGGHAVTVTLVNDVASYA